MEQPGGTLAIPMNAANPEALLRTVYLGDRACKSVTIDAWGRRLVMQVSCISRIRSESGQWEYYTDEDIDDGLIVFTGLKRLEFTPAGPVPNDAIHSIEVKTVSDDPSSPLFLFELSVGAVDDRGNVTETTIKLLAADMHLEDPAKPGIEIRR